ncbi:MAG: hypothetical protein V3U57_05370 [Robiginitomaculum sp.]
MATFWPSMREWLEENCPSKMREPMNRDTNLDINLYLKRIRVAQELFSDGHYHGNKVLEMRGI